MFKDFDIQKYLDKKPPSDNSFQTTQEIKELKKIPLSENIVKKFDDGRGNFEKVVGKDPIIKKIIDTSAPIITKIKKHHNRPRPAVLAKKLGIDLKDIKLKSMQSPAYPSGHSTQAVLLSLVLSDKYPDKKKQLKKLARDISYSRNVAHTHYKSDSRFGEKLGKDMYEHLKANSPLKCWKGYERVPGTAKGAKGSCRKASPTKKKMGDFKHSDAPDAKGKFKTMSSSSLASWLIKTRKGNLSKIISSLNQQYVFNRGKNPSYASKMKATMNIVRKRLKKNEKA